ncbi:MAG: Ig-like domain repeat protein, partial [Oscillospiraceae bacterium]|nr:Ig-like domain repeat protein [Oscillospiraceae bacterium]
MTLAAAGGCKVEIGLGPSVDASAPTLTVNETPRAGDVVRDKFLLSGTCTDDTEPLGLTVTFTSTKSGSSLKYTFAGENDEGLPVNKDGTWSLLVNPFKDEENGWDGILDGEYEVVVYVTDKGKHEISEKRLFRIDNTAPVIVLDRPSTKSTATKTAMDSYGQSFTLEGQSADDNDVKLIEINVFDEAPKADTETDEDDEIPAVKPLYTITLNDVPARINMDAAKWRQTEEYTDPDTGEVTSVYPYEKIYDPLTEDALSVQKKGTKPLYFTMNAYDSAVRYPVSLDSNDKDGPKSDDEKGNCTNGVYYLYEDISEIVSSYKITGLYNIFSNVYAGPNRSALNTIDIDQTTIDSVKGELEPYKITSGSFSLNPENSPTFSVTGRSGLIEDGTDFLEENTDQLLSNGTSVSIEVSPGLDSSPLLSGDVSADYNPETDLIKVYVQECDEKGQIIEDKPRIYPTSVKKQKVGSTYRFNVNLRKDTNRLCVVDEEGNEEWTDTKLEFRHNYRFGIEGKDKNGNNVMEKLDDDDLPVLYGFRFVSNGAAPGLEVTEPAENLIYLPKDSGVTFAGNVTTEDGDVTIDIYLGDEIVDTIDLKEDDFELITDESGEYFKADFESNLSKLNFDQEKSGQYAFKIIASNGKRSEAGKTVVYDVDPPSITVSSEKPKASGSFKISAGEDEDGNPLPAKDFTRNDFINKVFTLRGTIIDDYDRVEKTTWEFWQDGKVVDSGEITLNNFTLAIDTSQKSKYKEAEGKLVITSKDRAGNESSIERTYYIYQETDYPVILSGDEDALSFEIVTMSDLKNVVASGEKLNTRQEGQQLKFKFTDDDGIKTININTKSLSNENDKGEDILLAEKDINGATDYTYIYTVPPKAGYYIITFTVTDTEGQTNKVLNKDRVCILVTGEQLKINLNASPDWITTLVDDDSRGDVKTAFTIIGENIGDQGFTNVNYRQDEDQGSHDIRKSDDDFLTWRDTFEPNPERYSEAKIYKDEEIIYTAVGKTAGEVTGDATFKYKIDNVKPLLTKMDDDGNLKPVSIRLPNIQETTLSSFKITGEASDEGSGLSTVEVIAKNKDEGLNDNDEWQQAAVGGDGSWFYTLVFGDFPAVFGENGRKTLYVRAYDVVGNCSVIYSGDFDYDTADPEIKAESYIYTEKGEKKTVAIPANGSFSILQLFDIEGTASDDYGIDNIKVEQTKDDGKKTVIKTISGAELAAGSGKWKVSGLPRNADGTSQESAESGKYTYSFTVTDEVGKQTVTNVTVTIDTSAPTVQITRPGEDVAGTAALYGESYLFSGTAEDNDGGVGTASISYVFTQSETEPATGWTETASSGTWSIPRDLISGTTPASEKLHEGKWNLFVKAKDNAGNESATVQRSFWIDKGDPEVNADIPSDATTFYNEEEKYTLTGTASDSFGIEKIVVTNANNELGKTNEVVNGRWSIDIPNSKITENTLYNIIITVKDKAGKTTSISRKIYRDTRAPSFRITNPKEENQPVNTAFTVTGAVEDGSGSGVKAVYYTIDGSEPDENSEKATISSAAGTWSFELPLGNQGKVVIKAYAEDNLGNTTSIETGSIVYDTANPELKYTKFKNSNKEEVTVTGSVMNPVDYNSFVLSGRFTDSGTKLDVTVVRDFEDPLTVNYYKNEKNEEGYIADWYVTESNLDEGEHTYEITATDESRKTNVQKFSVITDTEDPDVTINAFPNNGDTKGTSYTFRGTARDETSGLNSISVTITDRATGKSYTQTATPSANWNSTVEYSEFGDVFKDGNKAREGLKDVEVKVTDKAGRIGIATGHFNYDTADPTVTLTASSFNEYMKVDGLNLSGTVYDSNAISELKITQKKKDSDDIVTDIVTKVITPSIKTGTQNWEVKVPFDMGNAFVTPEDGTYTYQLTVTDNAGNIVSSSEYSTLVDLSAPVVVIEKPAAEEIGINAINVTNYRINGTASDPNGLNAVWYQILPSSAAAPSAPTSDVLKDNSWNGWTKFTTSASWNANPEFKAKGATDSGLEEGTYKLYVRAVDNAGNVSNAEVREFDVDMSNPTLADRSTVASVTNAAFEIKGTASDTRGLESVTITDSLNATQSYSVTPAADKTWSLTLGNTENPIADGSRTFTVVATDVVGKTSSFTRNVTYDTHAPVVTPTAIAEDDSFISGNSYQFSGTAEDAEPSSGISEVNYTLYQKNNSATNSTWAASTATGASGAVSLDNEGAWSQRFYDLQNGYSYKVL